MIYPVEFALFNMIQVTACGGTMIYPVESTLFNMIQVTMWWYHDLPRRVYSLQYDSGNRVVQYHDLPRRVYSFQYDKGNHVVVP